MGAEGRSGSADPEHLAPAEIWSDTWARLIRATRDRRHAYRHPVIATAGPRTGPRARSVVLRAAEAEPATLTFYSDRRSGKFEALAADPRVSWCFYDPRRRVQVRAETRASIHVGDAQARSAWERQSPQARALYAAHPSPGAPLAEAAAEVGGDAERGFAHFAVVVCALAELDWLWLGRDFHRRLRFEPDADGRWQGIPIVP